MEKITITGVGSGVIVDDCEAYLGKVGEMFEVDGQSYMITRVENLSKIADGVYKNRPAALILRGFDNHPEGLV